MQRKELEQIKAEAERFILKVDEAVANMDAVALTGSSYEQKDDGSYAWVKNGKLRPTDDLSMVPKYSGNVRRASMDLTRALADLRRP